MQPSKPQKSRRQKYEDIIKRHEKKRGLKPASRLWSTDTPSTQAAKKKKKKKLESAIEAMSDYKKKYMK